MASRIKTRRRPPKDELARLRAGLNPDIEQICYYCWERKSVLAFSRDRSKPTGRKSYCRKCAAIPHSTLQIDSKACTICGVTKPTRDFHKRRDMPDGLQQACKECALGNQKQIYIRQKQDPPPPPKFQWCSRCEKTKSITEFYEKRGTNWCKACILEVQRKPAYRARQSGSVARTMDNHDYTEEEIARTDAHRLATYNDPCWWCGARKDRMVWLHTVPQSRGGLDLPENLHRACFSCSAARRAVK